MFNEVTEEMRGELSDASREKLRLIEEEIAGDGLVSPLAIQRFSDLSFVLAKESLETGRGCLIAAPLLNTFRELIGSDRLSIETRKKMQRLIGETELDFKYASGMRGVTSMRLAPYSMIKRARRERL